MNFNTDYSNTVLKFPNISRFSMTVGTIYTKQQQKTKLTVANSILFVCVSVLMVKTAWLESNPQVLLV